MVKLDRIYTGGGDKGETSLGDGTRVSKHGPRIVAQGEIDEANAAIGLARLYARTIGFTEIFGRVQNDMFDLGADVAVPGGATADGKLRISTVQIARLEAEIDAVNEALAPLRSFVVRGGTPEAAHLHFACTVVRRAERATAALAVAEPVNPLALVYLNRLSDLLFVMARAANDGGRADVLWVPGKTAEG